MNPMHRIQSIFISCFGKHAFQSSKMAFFSNSKRPEGLLEAGNRGCQVGLDLWIGEGN